MSRLSIVASLVLAYSSVASAHAVMYRRPPPPPVDPTPPAPPADPDTGHHFAQPPDALPMRPQHVLDRASVRAALEQARALNLARFRAYQNRGVFPSNNFSDDKLNVWRDADGHLCAAATIINASGQHDLVSRVADQNNFIRLADVTQGPLMDWILTSGLTQDEIAAIQEPFMPVGRRRQPIEPDLRTAENQRLRAKYTAVTRMLVANEKKSLDAATDRLMKRPQLAWRLVESSEAGEVGPNTRAAD
jgi:hypothetical protein